MFSSKYVSARACTASVSRVVKPGGEKRLEEDGLGSPGSLHSSALSVRCRFSGMRCIFLGCGCGCGTEHDDDV